MEAAPDASVNLCAPVAPSDTRLAVMGEVTRSIERLIRDRIEQGTYGPGDRLPSERELSAELGVGRTTVRLVLGKLTTLGLIEAQHGRGYFVPGSVENREELSREKADSFRWKTFGERTVYERKPWVSLNLVDVQPPGGGERFEHHVVRLFRAVIGLVLDDNDRVLMLWRHRFVSDQWGWELPGGIVDAGEDDALTAAREVEEETGWRPNSMRPLISFQPMIGMVDSPHAVYYAKGATFVGEPPASDEAGEVAWIPLSRIRGLLDKNEILGSGSIVGLLHLLAFGPPRS